MRLDHQLPLAAAAILIGLALIRVGHHLAQPRTQEDPR